MEKEVRLPFIVSGKSIGYFADSNNSTSYQGLFFKKDSWELFKTIDKFISLEGKKLEESDFELYYNYLELKKETGWLEIHLDFRFIHDYDDRGRVYSIYEEGNYLVIHYTKFKDFSLEEVEYETKTYVKGYKEYNYNEEWTKKSYDYDLSRYTKGEFYVNNGLKILPKKGMKIIFEEKGNKLFSKLKFKEKKKNGEISDKYIAFNALETLRIEKPIEGIIAGYPWFYQLWARDELIALKPYIDRDYKFVKNVISRHFERITEEGLLSNRYPESELGSIDAVGWLFKRTKQFIKELRKNKNLANVYKKYELENMLEKSIYTIKKLYESRSNEGLIESKELETWMDTSPDSDKRKGIRVEIQFLYHSMLELCEELSFILGKEESFGSIEFMDLIREKLILNGKLIDGFEEKEKKTLEPIRPNVFISYYINKNLLTKEEWENTFDEVLEECWLEWGGFSSITKNHPYFQSKHTGINNKSYHRGDSWYFVNNIAAMAMKDLNKDKYKYYIEKITKASVKDLKEQGFKNKCSEISSAEIQEAKGCWCQAWSASTLFELILKN